PHRFLGIVSGWSQLIGTFGDGTIKLQERRMCRNSGAPYFLAHVRAVSEGSEINGYFAVHPFVKAFMAIWLSWAFLLISVFGVGALGQAMNGDSEATLLALGA